MQQISHKRQFNPPLFLVVRTTFHPFFLSLYRWFRSRSLAFCASLSCSFSAVFFSYLRLLHARLCFSLYALHFSGSSLNFDQYLILSYHRTTQLHFKRAFLCFARNIMLCIALLMMYSIWNLVDILCWHVTHAFQQGATCTADYRRYFQQTFLMPS